MASTVSVDSKNPETLLFPEHREKAIIHYGEEARMKSMELFEGYELPGGLLPLQDVIEGGWVEETGFVWMSCRKKQEYHFKKADRHCRYAEVVSCFLEKRRMKKITGVKAKDMLVWVPVNEIMVDEEDVPKVHFKSIAGLSRSFPPEFFGRGA